jgi:hypothetical protein
MTGLFSTFYNSLDADPVKRGKQFEYFVKWFLTADPEWSTQVDQVWLWHELSSRSEKSNRCWAPAISDLGSGAHSIRRYWGTDRFGEPREAITRRFR